MEYLTLDFTTMEFHNGYVISHVKEGTILDKPQVQEMLDICQAFYDDKPYAYITYRQNKYNVNPVVYMNLKKISTCVGIIVVCNEESACKTAEFEKNFSKIPFKIFHDLKSGIECAKILLENKKAGL